MFKNIMIYSFIFCFVFSSINTTLYNSDDSSVIIHAKTRSGISKKSSKSKSTINRKAKSDCDVEDLATGDDDCKRGGFFSRIIMFMLFPFFFILIVILMIFFRKRK